jgi:preprotein translocase subunit SecB
MDSISKNIVEIALIQYRLLKCNAELKITTKPVAGGSLEISSAIKTPTAPSFLKKDDQFNINLSLEIIGKLKDSKDTAFSSSCEFEGKYQVINCEKNGVPTKENIKLWALAASQLQPLVSQFVADIALKMGLKNINPPPIILGQYTPIQRPKQTLPVKEKNKKSIQAKTK